MEDLRRALGKEADERPIQKEAAEAGAEGEEKSEGAPGVPQGGLQGQGAKAAAQRMAGLEAVFRGGLGYGPPIGTLIITPIKAREAIARITRFCDNNLEKCRMRSRHGGGVHGWDRLSVAELQRIVAELDECASQISASLDGEKVWDK
jgi:hypothetical protein